MRVNNNYIQIAVKTDSQRNNQCTDNDLRFGMMLVGQGEVYKQRETTKPGDNKRIITLRDDFPTREAFNFIMGWL